MKAEEGFMSDQPLNIPGGTYTPTETTFVEDSIGQQWATSMSDARLRPKVFGIHVWYRRNATAPWTFLFALENVHGTCVNGAVLPTLKRTSLSMIQALRHGRRAL
jgi:hypothetical protein